VWICRDKVTGRPRGDGIVGYEHAQAASQAIDRFNSTFSFLLALVFVAAEY